MKKTVAATMLAGTVLGSVFGSASIAAADDTPPLPKIFCGDVDPSGVFICIVQVGDFAYGWPTYPDSSNASEPVALLGLTAEVSPVFFLVGDETP